MIRENKGQDHAEFFTLHPEEFCREIISLVQGVDQRSSETAC